LATNEQHTFWNGQKRYKGQSRTMRVSGTIVDVAYRGIKRPVFGVASCDGDGRFIASKNDWDEHCTVCVGTLRNYILEDTLVAYKEQNLELLNACFQGAGGGRVAARPPAAARH
jgi:hypothetical protein